MKRYEIFFFPTATRRFGDTHTYQVEAEDLLEAMKLWAQDWPEGCAYYSKEGWDVEGHREIHNQIITDQVAPVEVIELTAKERREAMRKKKP